jgi:ribonuclease Z
VTGTAFLVSHGLVKPSYGYRVDYAGRSVALSGDTSPSDSLVAACKRVDVLIHAATAAPSDQRALQDIYSAR